MLPGMKDGALVRLENLPGTMGWGATFIALTVSAEVSWERLIVAIVAGAAAMVAGGIIVLKHEQRQAQPAKMDPPPNPDLTNDGLPSKEGLEWLAKAITNLRPEVTVWLIATQSRAELPDTAVVPPPPKEIVDAVRRQVGCTCSGGANHD
jgi:hypothetical protein